MPCHVLHMCWQCLLPPDSHPHSRMPAVMWTMSKGQGWGWKGLPRCGLACFCCPHVHNMTRMAVAACVPAPFQLASAAPCLTTQPRPRAAAMAWWSASWGTSTMSSSQVSRPAHMSHVSHCSSRHACTCLPATMHMPSRALLPPRGQGGPGGGGHLVHHNYKQTNEWLLLLCHPCSAGWRHHDHPPVSQRQL